MLIRDLALDREVFEFQSRVPTTNFALSDDGRQLATTHKDGSTTILSLPKSTSGLVERAKQGLPRCLHESELERYGNLLNIPKNPAWCHNKWPQDDKTQVFRSMPPQD